MNESFDLNNICLNTFLDGKECLYDRLYNTDFDFLYNKFLKYFPTFLG